ncbi:MAG: RNA methyltransferase, partial [Deltaproteobacteria bacterium]|nr:RNA methyltransferase [Deltaproteobacteria bacterium]
MKTRLKKENITIILVDTQIPENIGAAARAMNNMGIE